jgi:hypothetical protein
MFWSALVLEQHIVRQGLSPPAHTIDQIGEDRAQVGRDVGTSPISWPICLSRST